MFIESLQTIATAAAASEGSTKKLGKNMDIKCRWLLAMYKIFKKLSGVTVSEHVNE